MGGVLGQGSIPRPHGPAVFGPLGLLCSLPGSSCCTSPFSGKNGEKTTPRRSRGGRTQREQSVLVARKRRAGGGWIAGSCGIAGERSWTGGRWHCGIRRDNRGITGTPGELRDNRDTGSTAGHRENCRIGPGHREHCGITGTPGALQDNGDSREHCQPLLSLEGSEASLLFKLPATCVPLPFPCILQNPAGVCPGGLCIHTKLQDSSVSSGVCGFS